jgi:hypothetical protein
MVSTSRSAFVVVGACVLLAGGAALALATVERGTRAAEPSSAPGSGSSAPDRSRPANGLTGIVLGEPVPLSELAPMLEEAGLRPVEFSHEREASGSSEAVSGGYFGRGLPLAEQVEQYRATYRASGAGDDPTITTLVVEGVYTQTDLGRLASSVAQVVRLPDR